MPYYLQKLHAELAALKQLNSRFSQRAFAKLLGVDAGLFSKVMAGKRTVSKELAQQLCDGLQLTDAEQKFFMHSVLSAKTTKSVKNWNAELPKHEKTAEIDTALFEVMSEPYYYAILELTCTDDFQADSRWIARRLGLTAIEAQQAVAKLLHVGLLKKEDGSLRKTDAHFTTKDPDRTTDALKARYTRILEHAHTAMQKEPINRRNMTSMTMCIDPKLVPAAKAMIQEFTNSLCAYLESGSRSEVYELAISLFSLENDHRSFGIKLIILQLSLPPTNVVPFSELKAYRLIYP